MRTRDKLQLSSIVVLSLALVSMLVYFSPSTSSVTQVKSSNQDMPDGVSAISSSTQDNIQSPKKYDDSYTRIFNHVNESVVQITSTRSNINSHIIINGSPLDQKSVGLGSGFVYDTLGHIITNNHVIQDSNNVEVKFNSGNFYPAKVIGTDVYNDIAVLEITDKIDEHLQPLTFSDSSNLVVGEPAIAIGNPFGLSNTMTTGIISQTGRLLPTQENGGFSIPNVIQTDAAINPGNSGGPLLDINGNIIGMNTAIKTTTGEFSGIGFAIPSNTISKIVPLLIKNGVYKHPWIGISGIDMSSNVAEALGLPKNYKGVVVANLIDGGPAKMAGFHDAAYNNKQEIKNADIITTVDGQAVKSMADIIYYISEKNVGDKVLFTINRDGKMIDLYVLLQSRPNI